MSVIKKVPQFTLCSNGSPLFRIWTVESDDPNFNNTLYGGTPEPSKVNFIRIDNLMRTLGYSMNDGRNSRRAALTKAKHVLANLFFVPMDELRSIGDTDYQAVYELTKKKTFGTFIGNGGRANFVFWQPDQGQHDGHMFMFLFTQKSFTVLKSEKGVNGRYKFTETKLNWKDKPSLKGNDMPKVEVKPISVKPFAQPQSFNDMFTDIKSKFDKKTYVPPTTFTIKTRIFKDSGDFDAQFSDKELEKKMGKADEFVSAMVDGGMDDANAIHKLAVDLSVNHGVDYRQGKWFRKGDMMYQYYGTQNSKLFVTEKGIIHAFDLEVKTCKSTQAVMHTCTLPIEFEGKFNHFISVK